MSCCTVQTRPRTALRAGLLDEVEIHIVPVLLGQGRLFEHLSADHIEFELTG
jgi:hypothetical protein